MIAERHDDPQRLLRSSRDYFKMTRLLPLTVWTGHEWAGRGAMKGSL
jgi:hypothetical protein